MHQKYDDTEMIKLETNDLDGQRTSFIPLSTMHSTVTLLSLMHLFVTVSQ